MTYIGIKKELGYDIGKMPKIIQRIFKVKKITAFRAITLDEMLEVLINRSMIAAFEINGEEITVGKTTFKPDRKAVMLLIPEESEWKI